MRVFWLLLFLCAATQRARSAPTQSTLGWSIAPVSSLQKLTAKSRGILEPFPQTPIQLRAARGEWECFQIVVTAGREKLTNLRLKPTGLATHLAHFFPAENVQLFWENYVWVDKPSGNRRLEKLWWPDALIPLDLQPSRSIEPGRSEVLWGAIRVPLDAEPGQYFGAIDIEANGQPRTLAVTLTVEPVTLPAPTMRGNVAVYYDVLRDWYRKNGNTFDDAQWGKQKKAYYEFLLDYRLNAYDIPVDWNSDEADAYLTNPKVLSTRLPPLDRADFAPAVARLKKTGTLHKAFYYWIDEPAPQRYPEVLSTTKKLHAIDPRIKHCVTIHPNQSLKDAVDIWCPNIGDYFGLGYIDFKTLEAQRKRGRETWWYTMVEPKYPYPTWLLDDDAGAVRVYGWMMARWNISGFVYSMAHGWGPKPLENLQSFAGTNGDGTLLYPSELIGGSGPMPSIRLMLLRDAIEDYELLQTVRHLDDSLLMEWMALFPTPAAPRLDLPEDFLFENRRNEIFKILRAPKVQKAPRSTVDSELFLPTVSLGEISSRMTSAAPEIDGSATAKEWSRYRQASIKSLSRFGNKTRRASEDIPVPVWLCHDTKFLYFAARAWRRTKYVSGEWIAVEIAPVDASEKWRFVVTANDSDVVEKQMRKGRFRIEGFGWRGAAYATSKYFDVEMKIPLSIVGNARKFRLNVLRRVWDDELEINYIVRAVPDAGDARLMPFVQLEEVKKAAQKGTTRRAPTTSRAPKLSGPKSAPPRR